MSSKMSASQKPRSSGRSSNKTTYCLILFLLLSGKGKTMGTGIKSVVAEVGGKVLTSKEHEKLGTVACTFKCKPMKWEQELFESLGLRPARAT